MSPTLTVDPSLDACPVQPALIWAEGIAPPFEAVSAHPSYVAAIARAAELGEEAWEPGVRTSVRDMLRHGRYKPSGRSKPASEFLLKAAGKDTCPVVCPPVDVNNTISLESGLPGSLFDTDLCGESLMVRRGRPGESYVFNPSGQTIDLQDLLLTCRRAGQDWEPCGNPVKDAMTTKIRPETRRVVAVLYAPVGMATDRVEAWADRYAQLLRAECRAASVGFEIVKPGT